MIMPNYGPKSPKCDQNRAFIIVTPLPKLWNVTRLYTEAEINVQTSRSPITSRGNFRRLDKLNYGPVTLSGELSNMPVKNPYLFSFSVSHFRSVFE